MAAYFGYLLLAGMQFPFFYRKDISGRKYFDEARYLTICCLELILLAGFRGYTVGADTASNLSALSYYQNMPALKSLTAELVWPYNYENGYFLLVKLCAFLRVGKTAFLFIVAVLIYIPIFYTVKNHSRMPYLSILCYFAFGFFSYSLGILRQMIASSILLCGWKYIEERRLVKYLLIVATAMLFHTTAIAAILLYFMYGIGWKKMIGFVPPVEIVLLVLGRLIAMLIVKIFPQYASYIGSQYDTQGGTYLMLLVFNAVLLACVLIRSTQHTEVESLTICALILAICIQCIGYSMGVLGRASRHFSVYLIFAIPNVLSNLRQKIGHRWTFVATLCVVAVLFLFTYREFSGNKYVTPYYTIFD